jgi:hypothetical protein
LKLRNERRPAKPQIEPGAAHSGKYRMLYWAYSAFLVGMTASLAAFVAEGVI